MRNMKYVIGLLLLFMFIGFATVSISLSINGNVNVLSDLDDFKVYFSNIKVNGTQDLKLVKSDKELMFDVELSGLGTTYVLEYEVTNASSVFDAQIDIDCIQGDELLSITNSFDDSNLLAKSSRVGTLTLKKMKANVNESDVKYSIVCSISAIAVGRDAEASGVVSEPLPPYKYLVGNEVTIGSETFNVISSTDDTVTMLAQYNIYNDGGFSPYVQTETANTTTFSDLPGWKYTPGPKDIDIFSFKGFAYYSVELYFNRLKLATVDENLTTTLITLSQLEKLGCIIQEDYSTTGQETCANSPHASWLINGQNWWTRSAVSNSSLNEIFYVSSTGSLSNTYYNDGYTGGIRPVITISKEVLERGYYFFEISGKTYKMENGMTWREWVDSEYNTDNYFIKDNDIHADSTRVIVFSGMIIGVNSDLVAGTQYDVMDFEDFQ